MDEIIRILKINFNYPEKNIFSDFSLEIKRGDFVSIIGPNSSGKSTLIKILTGILPASGFIIIDGYALNKDTLKEIRRKMGIVFSDPNYHFVGETVMDDLAFSLENLQYSREEITNSINNIANIFKIKNILENDPNKLSNSDKQKVAIAGALIHNPRMLLLDDAFHELTPLSKEKIFSVLKEYQKEYGLTIIMSTNAIEDALYSDRTIVLDQGKIYLDGKTKDILLKEKELNCLGLKKPFMVDLSLKLKLYDLIDKAYFNMEELVDDLWK